jgi:hypothetical protein
MKTQIRIFCIEKEWLSVIFVFGIKEDNRLLKDTQTKLNMRNGKNRVVESIMVIGKL